MLRSATRSARRTSRWTSSTAGATSRRWDGRAATASTWYEPLREQPDIDLATHWVLGRPEVFLLTTGDVEILPKLLDAAERYEKRPSDEQMDELTRRRDLAPLFV